MSKQTQQMSSFHSTCKSFSIRIAAATLLTRANSKDKATVKHTAQELRRLVLGTQGNMLREFMSFGTGTMID